MMRPSLHGKDPRLIQNFGFGAICDLPRLLRLCNSRKADDFILDHGLQDARGDVRLPVHCPRNVQRYPQPRGNTTAARQQSSLLVTWKLATAPMSRCSSLPRDQQPTSVSASSSRDLSRTRKRPPAGSSCGSSGVETDTIVAWEGANGITVFMGPQLSLSPRPKPYPASAHTTHRTWIYARYCSPAALLEARNLSSSTRMLARCDMSPKNRKMFIVPAARLRRSLPVRPPLSV